VDSPSKNGKPEIVAKAKEIFKKAHRPDPNWPLTGSDQKHKDLSKEAWLIKRQRDKDHWIPPNAKPLKKL
jgi:hypothetical protein